MQWGSMYARACIRLQPNDSDRIVTAAVNVIGELPGVDWSARTKGSINYLETALSDWNDGGEHDAALEEIRSAMLQLCGAVDSESAATCNAFLAPDA